MISTAILEENAELIVPVNKTRFQRHAGATHPSADVVAFTVFEEGKGVEQNLVVTKLRTGGDLNAAAEAHEHLRNWHSGSAPVPLNDVFSLPEELTGTELEMVHEEPARKDPDGTGGDTSLTESDLGWKARCSLHDGLQTQIDWLARSGHERA